ncbi:unnamed protein product [Urochloa decumbens]|uniref:Uncharacterized protein n=1 Tax=Urochloa decumbens TaxID=240449 RepID=A0ABC8WJD3_9POAL
MSGCGHRRQPSIIPKNVALLKFEEIMVDDTAIASHKRSGKEDTPYVGNKINYQNFNKEATTDKKSILSDGKGTNDKDGVNNLATQVKTSLVIKDI